MSIKSSSSSIATINKVIHYSQDIKYTINVAMWRRTCHVLLTTQDLTPVGVNSYFVQKYWVIIFFSLIPETGYRLNPVTVNRFAGHF